MPDHIILEHKAVDRLGIQQRSVKRVKLIVGNHYAGMKIPFLVAEIGNLGINRYHSVGKLKHVGERIHKPVLPYGHIAARPGLEPSVAVSAKQNAGARRMVKQIVLHHHLARRREQSATGAVVSHYIVGKRHLWSPRKVLYAESPAIRTYRIRQHMPQPDNKLLCAGQ